MKPSHSLRWFLAFFLAAVPWLLYPQPAKAEESSVKIVGYHQDNTRVLLRKFSEGENEGGRYFSLSITVFHLEGKKVLQAFPIVTDEDVMHLLDMAPNVDLNRHPDVRRIRGQRWQQAEAQLRRDGFVIDGSYPALPVQENRRVDVPGLGASIAFRERPLPEGLARPAEDLVITGMDRVMPLVAGYYQEVGLGDMAAVPRGYISNAYLSPDKKQIILLIGGYTWGQPSVLVYSLAELSRLIARG